MVPNARPLCLSVLLLLAGSSPLLAQASPVARDLVIHLRADTGVETDVTGGVITWSDFAPDGVSHDAVQLTTAARPVLIAGAAGQPAIRFDGVGDFLSVAADSELATDTFTWFVVFTPSDMPTGLVAGIDDAGGLISTGYQAGAGSSSSRTWGSYLSRDNEVVSYARASDGSFVGAMSPITPDQTYVISASWRADDSVLHTLNGAPEPPASPADALPATHLGTEIGAFPIAGFGHTRFLDGDIAEILVYTTELTERERAEVDAYLADRYGVVGNFEFDGDGDRLLIGDELALGTDPFDPDTDADSLLDGDEVATGCADPLIADTDGDGVVDGIEVLDGTDPCSNDSDNDGIPDAVERQGCTDPANPDSDGDALLDGEELTRGLDPCQPDTDNDGLSDGEEVALGCPDPLSPDTDGDGLLDGDEVANGSDPCVPGSALPEPEEPPLTPADVADSFRELADDVAALDLEVFATSRCFPPGLLRKAQRYPRFAAKLQRFFERQQLRRQRWIVRRLDRIADRVEQGNHRCAERKLARLVRQLESSRSWIRDDDVRTDVLLSLDGLAADLDSLSSDLVAFDAHARPR